MEQTLVALRDGHLDGATQIRLRENLEVFPEELFRLKDSLEILDLSDNRLNHLPDRFVEFQKLRILFLSGNRFEHYPKLLGRMPSLSMVGFKSNRIESIEPGSLSPGLRWLILTDNRIGSLPGDIGNLRNLQKCMLAGNRLGRIPREMERCHSLELLRLSANQLEEFPDFLLELPRLSWLAMGGNPMSPDVAAPDLPVFRLDDLTITDLIGEGASGKIHRGQIKRNNQPVAIKIFKGEVTSDGYPLDEWRATVAAGQGPGLVPVRGILKDGENQVAGLILDLLPDGYSPLGLPPDFQSCTRDTFRPDTGFSSGKTLQILKRVASTVSHLHRTGIIHGDLYAHNILIHPDGETILSDFGAASLLSPENPERNRMLQSLESRAFGCLVEDLLNHTDFPANDPGAVLLVALRDRCLSPRHQNRPLFPEIVDILNQLD